MLMLFIVSVMTMTMYIWVGIFMLELICFSLNKDADRLQTVFGILLWPILFTSYLINEIKDWYDGHT